MNKNERRFLKQLFPGDPIWEENPAADIPPEVKLLLERISCRTEVKTAWLERSIRLVLQGLAGLRCLWYLHSMTGKWQAVNERDMPEWANAIQLMSGYSEAHFDRMSAKDEHFIGFGAPSLDWEKGLFSFSILKDNRDPQRRTIRLGKLLRELDAFPETIREFETRELEQWEWRISAHPFDVLTMSHERPWTSCMRPGGEYELGPLVDMAAGSALLFWYRPGAAKPCGRVILRPEIFPVGGKLEPGVFVSPRRYGDGPNITEDEEFYAMVGSELICSVGGDLCESGWAGRALSKNIYDDGSRAECTQSEEQYQRAYKALAAMPWPEPQPVWEDDIRDVAVTLLEQDLDLPEGWLPNLELIGTDIAAHYLAASNGTIPELLDLYQNFARGDLPLGDDLFHYALPRDSPTMEISRAGAQVFATELTEQFVDVGAHFIAIYSEDDSDSGSSAKTHIYEELWREIAEAYPTLDADEMIHVDSFPFEMHFEPVAELSEKARPDSHPEWIIAFPSFLHARIANEAVEESLSQYDVSISIVRLDGEWRWSWDRMF